MNATRLAFHEVVLLEPKVFGDARGVFYESYNEKVFEAATGLSHRFVQDNHSVSAKRVVRGLHYQLPPHAQGKLVRVVAGAVFDVVVDIRRGSPQFGHWIGVELSAQNRRQLWVPEGFAHGFLALEAASEVLYKATTIMPRKVSAAFYGAIPTSASSGAKRRRSSPTRTGSACL